MLPHVGHNAVRWNMVTLANICIVFAFGYFRSHKTTEITCDGFRPIYNMSDISCVMGTFSYKNIAQWVHLFLMEFNDFRSFLLCFSLKCPFPIIKSSLNGNTIHMQLLSIKGLDAILPGLNCFISMIISMTARRGFQP